jgi:hypothetical protein
MESELRPLESTNRIDDTISEPDQELDQEPEVYHHMMYPPAQPMEFSHPPRQHRQTSIFDDGGDKLFYIVLFVSFILGFFMGKTMQPIVIRST